MINGIKIRNFQNHESTALSLSTGVNIIQGPSDHGKSAIIRAIYWVVFNRPSGEEFRANTGGNTLAELLLDSFELSPVSISRVRTDKDNYYRINREDPLRSFGTTVPEGIQNLIDLTEYNFQLQMDSPYLLAAEWTPQRVSAKLNQIADLSLIDSSQAWLAQKLRQANRGLETAENEINKYQEEKDRLPDLVLLDAEITTLEKIEAERDRLYQEQTTLTRQLRIYTQAEADLQEVQKRDGLEEQAREIIKEGETHERLVKEYNQLRTALEKLELAQQEYREANAAWEGSKTNFEAEFPDVCPLCGQEVPE